MASEIAILDNIQSLAAENIHHCDWTIFRVPCLPAGHGFLHERTFLIQDNNNHDIRSSSDPETDMHEIAARHNFHCYAGVDNNHIPDFVEIGHDHPMHCLKYHAAEPHHPAYEEAEEAANMHYQNFLCPAQFECAATMHPGLQPSPEAVAEEIANWH